MPYLNKIKALLLTYSEMMNPFKKKSSLLLRKKKEVPLGNQRNRKKFCQNTFTLKRSLESQECISTVSLDLGHI
jgi:hypothetical protein